MRRAFTLAEVLITLGIIGVIAAMTLPSLINKADEKIIVNKLKRTYSEIANAIDMRKAALGTSDYAEQFSPRYTAEEQLKGFTKNLHVIEYCKASNRNGCGGVYKVKPKKKTNDGYGNIKEATRFDVNERAILNDGTMIIFSKRNWTGNCEIQYTTYERDKDGNYTNIIDGKPVPVTYTKHHCAEIFFDVNGPQKGRNQFGYDVYSFAVTPNTIDQHSGNGGMYDTMRTEQLTYEKYGSGKF